MAVVNVTPPVITGTAQRGTPLNTSNGTWTWDDDNFNLAYAYRWLRCDSAGANCVAIPGAVGVSYTPSVSDVGSRLRSEVTATEVAIPVSGPELTWSPFPAGAGGTTIVNWTMTNANRTSSTLGAGAGRDLVITNNEVLTGPVAQLIGWRYINWIGGEFGMTVPSSGAIIPRDITGGIHIEGIRFNTNNVTGDFLAPRLTVPTIQCQNCYISVRTVGGAHADAFQTQVCAIDSLRFDNVTIATDYQGIFQNNEVAALYGFPALVTKVDETIIKRTNFKHGKASGAEPSGTYLFKGFPGHPDHGVTDRYPGPWTLTDVWIPAGESGNVYPDPFFRQFGFTSESHMRYGAFVVGSTVVFSDGTGTVPTGTYAGQTTFDCEIDGVINLGTPPGGDFCPESTAGLNYVSPGYV